MALYIRERSQVESGYMLLTGYLENLVPFPNPSILSSYTVSLNLKIEKKKSTTPDPGVNSSLYFLCLQHSLYQTFCRFSFI